MNLPSLKQLRYFVALTDERHFGRAAALCFVSQSAFSTAIKDLETLLGARLVERSNRQLRITEAGEKVATRARECLRTAEQLVESARQQDQPLTGDLRLGAIPTIAPFMLPQALPRIRRAHPRLNLYLAEDQTARLHTRLLNNQLDVVLLALPFTLPGTEVLPLFRDRFLLACRENTERVDPNNYRFRKITPGSVILLEDGHCLRNHALDACKLRGTEKINRFAASSLLTLVEMIDADLGISYLPEIAAASTLLRNTRVRLHPLHDDSYRTIGLAWRKGSARENEFRLLGELLSAQRPT